ncbi:tubulin-specific chaperone cofactor E-like protein [Glandiceps talaboti]
MATNASSPKPDKKVSLPQAFKERYQDDESQSEGIGSIVIALPSRKSGSAPFVPQCLTFYDCCINCAGDDGEIEKLCPGVKELDLTQNKLEDWKEVFSIVSQLPHLQFLNLSANPLTQPLAKEQLEIVSMAPITKLVLNNTRVKWDALPLLLSIMPKLEELHLSLNSYGTVDISGTPHTGIKLLQFNNNGITDFQQICKLGKVFPNLEHLYLVENNIQMLSGNFPDSFPCLKCLSITNNEISSWEELDKINEFPKLSDIRIKCIPFLDTYPEKERRALVVARLPGVLRLNGTRITETEREDAERRFIRYYMDKDPDEQPQRYHDLVKVCGKLDPLVEIDMSPDYVVCCLIKYEDKQSLMKVDTKKTVLEFKAELESFVGLPPNEFRLFYFDHDMIGTAYGGREELASAKRHLHAFKLKDGDEFHIEKHWHGAEGKFCSTCLTCLYQ